MNTDRINGKIEIRVHPCPSVVQKQTVFGEEKALAGFGIYGHPGSDMQLVVSTPFPPPTV
jgi:hypothetical protein